MQCVSVLHAACKAGDLEKVNILLGVPRTSRAAERLLRRCCRLSVSRPGNCHKTKTVLENKSQIHSQRQDHETCLCPSPLRQ